MAITCASESASDTSLADGIRGGDLSAATRFWVRHWNTALATARQCVDPLESPGLAAEALISTVSLIAIGQGPGARGQDVPAFVTASVLDLVEEDEAPEDGTAHVEDVFSSPGLRRAFADLPPGAQQSLRDWDQQGPGDEASLYALQILQAAYVAQRLTEAAGLACRGPHLALMAAVEASEQESFTAANWLHLSTCAWCTETFHELAFSNVALEALVFAPVSAATAAEPTTHRAGVHAVLRSGRSRLLTAAAFTAAVAVIGVTLSQTVLSDEGTDPAPSAASNAQPSPEGFVTGGNDAFTLGSLPEPTEEPTDEPSDGPSATATRTPNPPAPTLTAITNPSPSAVPTPSATSKPTKKPSKSPTAPASTPTPTPTQAPSQSAEPTPACNDLQHLLAIC